MANDFDDPILIPPGGGGGAPLGPGAMVANSLQSILARQRAQKQQDLINSLAQSKVANEQTYRQGQLALGNRNAASEEAWRKAESTRADAQTKKLADEEASKSAMEKHVQDWATAQAGTETDPTLRSMYGFMSQFPGRSEQLMQAILAREAAKKAMVPGKAFNVKSGKYEDMLDTKNNPILVNEGTAPYRETTPPNPPQQHYQDLGPEMDENNKPTGNQVIMDTNTMAIARVPFRVGSKGGGAKTPSYEFPSAVISKLNGMRYGNPAHVPPIPGAIPTPASGVGAFFGMSPTEHPEQAKAWRSAVVQEVANLNLPEQLRTTFANVINDAGSDAYDSHTIAQAQSGLSPEDKTHLEKLLLAVRGN